MNYYKVETRICSSYITKKVNKINQLKYVFKVLKNINNM